MVSFEDIIIASKHNYNKISFDVAKIRNDTKLRNTYKINPEEKIIAYLKLGLLYPLSVFGNIITDQAIYSNPAVSGDTNRFAYSNLHQYVVIKKSEKDGVILVGTEGTFIINGGSLLQNNVSGDELLTFIKTIQQELFKSSVIAEERISEIKKILQNIRQEFCHGSIPVYYEQFKNSIHKENICSDDFLNLDAEIAFRSGNHNQFINLINMTSYKTNNHLENCYENFAQSFICDLSNISFDFDQEYIKKVYANLCQVTADHKYSSLIFAYVCIRQGDGERYSSLKKSVVSELGTEIAVKLETFRERYANKQMLEIYKMISNDEVPKKETLENTDSLGLNPMHYALILKKDTVIENLLKKQNKFSKCDLSEDDDAFPCYNIAIIACLLNLNKKNDIITAMSSDISKKAQIKARFDKELVLLQTTKAAQNKIIDQYQKILHQVRTNEKYAQVDGTKIEEIYDKIETAEEKIEKIEEHIFDLEDKIDDIQGEIDDMISDETAEYMDQVETLLSSDNPFVQILINLYQNPDMLYNILSSQENDQRLYEYNNFNFIMPTQFEINLPYISYLK